MTGTPFYAMREKHHESLTVELENSFSNVIANAVKSAVSANPQKVSE